MFDEIFCPPVDEKIYEEWDPLFDDPLAMSDKMPMQIANNPPKPPCESPFPRLQFPDNVHDLVDLIKLVEGDLANLKHVESMFMRDHGGNIDVMAVCAFMRGNIQARLSYRETLVSRLQKLENVEKANFNFAMRRKRKRKR